MPTTISPPTTPKMHSKGKKMCNWGKKSESIESPKGACTQCAECAGQHRPQRTLCTRCATVYEKIYALLMNATFMNLVGLSTTSSLTPNMI